MGRKKMTPPPQLVLQCRDLKDKGFTLNAAIDYFHAKKTTFKRWLNEYGTNWSSLEPLLPTLSDPPTRPNSPPATPVAPVDPLPETPLTNPDEITRDYIEFKLLHCQGKEELARIKAMQEFLVKKEKMTEIARQEPDELTLQELVDYVFDRLGNS